ASRSCGMDEWHGAAPRSPTTENGVRPRSQHRNRGRSERGSEMSQERRGTAGRLLMEMFRRENYPDGFPADMSEEKLYEHFEAWLENCSDNEDIQALSEQMVNDYQCDMMEAALSSPEGQAEGFRSFMRPNADGTFTQLWAKHTPDAAPPEPNAKDPARN